MMPLYNLFQRISTMKLKYVSLTGADDKTSIQTLKDMEHVFPLVEWAILMFPEREGLNRNPSPAWREDFYQANVKQCALHVCGSAIEKLAAQQDDLLEEIQNFDRVQINLKPNRATPELVSQLVQVVKAHPHIQFITQHNENNRPYFSYWQEVENHAYLFDASLGKGVAPELWQEPIKGKFCGYAGGLSPEVLSSELLKIAQVTKNQTIWIDMETGLRTNDEFDLEKVLKVLEISHQ